MIRYLVAFVTMLFVMVSNAYALPAFARQMGVSCDACHTENGFSNLTRFGRDFKASGYTMVGSEELVSSSGTGNSLSIPQTLNMSFEAAGSVKSGGVSTAPTAAHANGTTFGDNSIDLYVAGRIGEHMGTYAEIGYKEATGFALSNIILPITYKLGDNTYGLVPYNTDGHGPLEFWLISSTTALKNVGASGTAKAVTAYVYNPDYFLSYTAWSAGNAANKSNQAISFASSFRAVYTPQVGAWDLAFGAYYLTGSTNNTTTATFASGNVTGVVATANTGTALVKTDAYALDFQAVGNLGKYPVNIDMDYAQANKNSFNWTPGTPVPNSRASFDVTAQFGIIPRELVIVGEYTTNNDGTGVDTASTAYITDTEKVSLKYFLAQNIVLQADFTETAKKTNAVAFSWKAYF